MHLVWDWNGTLLDDIHLVVTATNAAFATIGGPVVTVDEHRRGFCRPVSDYYSRVLGRDLTAAEFARLDDVFHECYRGALADVALAADAREAMAMWAGTQSLLSMWFHHELVPTVARFGLSFARVDGLREALGGGFKAAHLKTHLLELSLEGPDVVLIGDSVDDADAAEAVGARCVLYDGGFTHPDNLRARGVPVASSLVEAVAIAAG
ncbi:HAD family hydrolase [Allorhizocola rhizosphaerae]|uniref:HAD family hydrolase n=1 Tax=Allorhizocola rhizosphaerae TaxID=1872709 RepID=UPI000E3E4DE4|nr:HAD hydrolase-like protein [Allorhizocola rhizosphaerae]